MDFSALVAELRDVAEKYKGKTTDTSVSTIVYVDMFTKILQRAERLIRKYEDQIMMLWVALNQLATLYKDLAAGTARDQLTRFIFGMCARTVLNIQWPQLEEDNSVKQNFCKTVENVHEILTGLGFNRFQLILDLMENHWTHPTLTQIMSGDEEDEIEDGLEYIQKQDPEILKLRIEIMMKENCEEFALNLCTWSLKHPALKNDLKIKEHQIVIMYRQQEYEKMQEVCETIACHDGIKVIAHLAKNQANQSLCIRLAQIFLVQDWIKPDRNCCTQELLKLWIHHQYLDDKDEERFLESIWAVAKVSRSTEQIGVLIDGVRKVCGDMFIQLYTELCKYAINIDKGNMEKELERENLEAVKERQFAIAKTCVRMAYMLKEYDFRIAKICGLTAFALDTTFDSLNLVNRLYWTVKFTAATSSESKVNPATLYEIERLLEPLRPNVLDHEYTWKKIIPLCKKYKTERDVLLKESCQYVPVLRDPKQSLKYFKKAGSNNSTSPSQKASTSGADSSVQTSPSGIHPDKLQKPTAVDIDRLLGQQFPRGVGKNMDDFSMKDLDKTINDLKKSINEETEYRKMLQAAGISGAGELKQSTSAPRDSSVKKERVKKEAKMGQQSGQRSNVNTAKQAIPQTNSNLSNEGQNLQTLYLSQSQYQQYQAANNTVPPVAHRNTPGPFSPPIAHQGTPGFKSPPMAHSNHPPSSPRDVTSPQSSGSNQYHSKVYRQNSTPVSVNQNTSVSSPSYRQPGTSHITSDALKHSLSTKIHSEMLRKSQVLSGSVTQLNINSPSGSSLQRQHSVPNLPSAVTNERRSYTIEYSTNASSSPAECAKIAQQIAQMHLKQRAERERLEGKKPRKPRQKKVDDVPKTSLTSRTVFSKDQISELLSQTIKSGTETAQDRVQNIAQIRNQILQAESANRLNSEGKQLNPNIQQLGTSAALKRTVDNSNLNTQTAMSANIIGPSDQTQNQKFYLTSPSVMDKLKKDNSGGVNLSDSKGLSVKPVFSMIVPRALTTRDNQEELFRRVTNMVKRATSSKESTVASLTSPVSSQLQSAVKAASSSTMSRPKVAEEIKSMPVPDHVLEFLKTKSKDEQKPQPNDSNRMVVRSVNMTEQDQNRSSSALQCGVSPAGTFSSTSRQQMQGSGFVTVSQNSSSVVSSASTLGEVNNSSVSQFTALTGVVLPPGQASLNMLASVASNSATLQNQMPGSDTNQNHVYQQPAISQPPSLQQNLSQVQTTLQQANFPTQPNAEARIRLPVTSEQSQQRFMRIFDQFGNKQIVNMTPQTHLIQTGSNAKVLGQTNSAIPMQQNLGGAQSSFSPQLSSVEVLQQVAPSTESINNFIPLQPIIPAVVSDQSSSMLSPVRQVLPSTSTVVSVAPQAGTGIPRQQFNIVPELSPAVVQQILTDLMKSGAQQQQQDLTSSGQSGTRFTSLSSQNNQLSNQSQTKQHKREIYIFPKSQADKSVDGTMQIIKDSSTGNIARTVVDNTKQILSGQISTNEMKMVPGIPRPGQFVNQNMQIGTRQNFSSISTQSSYQPSTTLSHSRKSVNQYNQTVQNISSDQIYSNYMTSKGVHNTSLVPKVSSSVIQSSTIPTFSHSQTQIPNQLLQVPDLPDLGSKEFGIDEILRTDNPEQISLKAEAADNQMQKEAVLNRNDQLNVSQDMGVGKVEKDKNSSGLSAPSSHQDIVQIYSDQDMLKHVESMLSGKKNATLTSKQTGQIVKQEWKAEDQQSNQQFNKPSLSNSHKLDAGPVINEPNKDEASPQGSNLGTTLQQEHVESKVIQSKSTFFNAARLAKEREEREMKMKQEKPVVMKQEEKLTVNICGICSQTLPSVEKLKEHVKFNMCPSKVCKVCEKTFPTLEALLNHLKLPCKGSKERKQLKDFEYTKIFVCSKCNFTSQNEKIGTKHVENCNVSSSPIKAKVTIWYKCHMCREVLHDKDLAYKHISRFCPQLKAAKAMQVTQEAIDKLRSKVEKATIYSNTSYKDPKSLIQDAFLPEKSSVHNVKPEIPDSQRVTKIDRRYQVNKKSETESLEREIRAEDDRSDSGNQTISLKNLDQVEPKTLLPENIEQVSHELNATQDLKDTDKSGITSINNRMKERESKSETTDTAEAKLCETVHKSADELIQTNEHYIKHSENTQKLSESNLKNMKTTEKDIKIDEENRQKKKNEGKMPKTRKIHVPPTEESDTEKQQVKSVHNRNKKSDRKDLEKKQETNENETPSTCKLCLYSTASGQSLARHYTQAHDFGFRLQSKRYRCKYCCVSFQSSSKVKIKGHLKKHSEILLKQIAKSKHLNKNYPHLTPEKKKGNLVSKVDYSPRRMKKHMKARAARSKCAENLKRLLYENKAAVDDEYDSEELKAEGLVTVERRGRPRKYPVGQEPYIVNRSSYMRSYVKKSKFLNNREKSISKEIKEMTGENKLESISKTRSSSSTTRASSGIELDNEHKRVSEKNVLKHKTKIDHGKKKDPERQEALKQVESRGLRPKTRSSVTVSSDADVSEIEDEPGTPMKDRLRKRKVYEVEVDMPKRISGNKVIDVLNEFKLKVERVKNVTVSQKDQKDVSAKPEKSRDIRRSLGARQSQAVEVSTDSENEEDTEDKKRTLRPRNGQKFEDNLKEENDSSAKRKSLKRVKEVKKHADSDADQSDIEAEVSIQKRPRRSGANYSNQIEQENEDKNDDHSKRKVKTVKKVENESEESNDEFKDDRPYSFSRASKTKRNVTNESAEASKNKLTDLSVDINSESSSSENDSESSSSENEGRATPVKERLRGRKVLNKETAAIENLNSKVILEVSDIKLKEAEHSEDVDSDTEQERVEVRKYALRDRSKLINKQKTDESFEGDIQASIDVIFNAVEKEFETLATNDIDSNNGSDIEIISESSSDANCVTFKNKQRCELPKKVTQPPTKKKMENRDSSIVSLTLADDDEFSFVKLGDTSIHDKAQIVHAENEDKTKSVLIEDEEFSFVKSKSTTLSTRKDYEPEKKVELVNGLPQENFGSEFLKFTRKRLNENMSAANTNFNLETDKTTDNQPKSRKSGSTLQEVMPTKLTEKSASAFAKDKTGIDQTNTGTNFAAAFQAFACKPASLNEDESDRLVKLPDETTASSELVREEQKTNQQTTVKQNKEQISFDTKGSNTVKSPVTSSKASITKSGFVDAYEQFTKNLPRIMPEHKSIERQTKQSKSQVTTESDKKSTKETTKQVSGRKAIEQILPKCNVHVDRLTVKEIEEYTSTKKSKIQLHRSSKISHPKPFEGPLKKEKESLYKKELAVASEIIILDSEDESQEEEPSEIFISSGEVKDLDGGSKEESKSKDSFDEHVSKQSGDSDDVSAKHTDKKFNEGKKGEILKETKNTSNDEEETRKEIINEDDEMHTCTDKNQEVQNDTINVYGITDTKDNPKTKNPVETKSSEKIQKVKEKDNQIVVTEAPSTFKEKEIIIQEPESNKNIRLADNQMENKIDSVGVETNISSVQLAIDGIVGEKNNLESESEISKDFENNESKVPNSADGIEEATTRQTFYNPVAGCQAEERDSGKSKQMLSNTPSKTEETGIIVLEKELHNKVANFPENRTEQKIGRSFAGDTNVSLETIDEKMDNDQLHLESKILPEALEEVTVNQDFGKEQLLNKSPRNAEIMTEIFLEEPQNDDAESLNVLESQMNNTNIRNRMESVFDIDITQEKGSKVIESQDVVTNQDMEYHTNTDSAENSDDKMVEGSCFSASANKIPATIAVYESKEEPSVDLVRDKVVNRDIVFSKTSVLSSDKQSHQSEMSNIPENVRHDDPSRFIIEDTPHKATVLTHKTTKSEKQFDGAVGAINSSFQKSLDANNIDSQETVEPASVSFVEPNFDFHEQANLKESKLLEENNEPSVGLKHEPHLSMYDNLEMENTGLNKSEQTETNLPLKGLVEHKTKQTESEKGAAVTYESLAFVTNETETKTTPTEVTAMHEHKTEILQLKKEVDFVEDFANKVTESKGVSPEVSNSHAVESLVQESSEILVSSKMQSDKVKESQTAHSSPQTIKLVTYSDDESEEDTCEPVSVKQIQVGKQSTREAPVELSDEKQVKNTQGIIESIQSLVFSDDADLESKNKVNETSDSRNNGVSRENRISQEEQMAMAYLRSVWKEKEAGSDVEYENEKAQSDVSDDANEASDPLEIVSEKQKQEVCTFSAEKSAHVKSSSQIPDANKICNSIDSFAAVVPTVMQHYSGNICTQTTVRNSHSQNLSVELGDKVSTSLDFVGEQMLTDTTGEGSNNISTGHINKPVNNLNESILQSSPLQKLQAISQVGHSYKECTLDHKLSQIHEPMETDALFLENEEENIALAQSTMESANGQREDTESFADSINRFAKGTGHHPQMPDEIKPSELVSEVGCVSQRQHSDTAVRIEQCSIFEDHGITGVSKDNGIIEKNDTDLSFGKQTEAKADPAEYVSKSKDKKATETAQLNITSGDHAITEKYIWDSRGIEKNDTDLNFAIEKGVKVNDVECASKDLIPTETYKIKIPPKDHDIAEECVRNKVTEKKDTGVVFREQGQLKENEKELYKERTVPEADEMVISSKPYKIAENELKDNKVTVKNDTGVPLSEQGGAKANNNEVASKGVAKSETDKMNIALKENEVVEDVLEGVEGITETLDKDLIYRVQREPKENEAEFFSNEFSVTEIHKTKIALEYPEIAEKSFGDKEISEKNDIQVTFQEHLKEKGNYEEILPEDIANHKTDQMKFASKAHEIVENDFKNEEVTEKNTTSVIIGKQHQAEEVNNEFVSEDIAKTATNKMENTFKAEEIAEVDVRDKGVTGKNNNEVTFKDYGVTQENEEIMLEERANNETDEMNNYSEAHEIAQNDLSEKGVIKKNDTGLTFGDKGRMKEISEGIAITESNGISIALKDQEIAEKDVRDKGVTGMNDMGVTFGDQEGANSNESELVTEGRVITTTNEINIVSKDNGNREEIISCKGVAEKNNTQGTFEEQEEVSANDVELISKGLTVIETDELTVDSNNAELRGKGIGDNISEDQRISYMNESNLANRILKTDADFADRRNLEAHHTENSECNQIVLEKYSPKDIGSSEIKENIETKSGVVETGFNGRDNMVPLTQESISDQLEPTELDDMHENIKSVRRSFERDLMQLGEYNTEIMKVQNDKHAFAPGVTLVESNQSSVKSGQYQLSVETQPVIPAQKSGLSSNSLSQDSAVCNSVTDSDKHVLVEGISDKIESTSEKIENRKVFICDKEYEADGSSGKEMEESMKETDVKENFNVTARTDEAVQTSKVTTNEKGGLCFCQTEVVAKGSADISEDTFSLDPANFVALTANMIHEKTLGKDTSNTSFETQTVNEHSKEEKAVDSLAADHNEIACQGIRNEAEMEGSENVNKTVDYTYHEVAKDTGELKCVVVQQYNILENKEISEILGSEKIQYADHSYSNKISEDPKDNFSERQTNETDIDDETKIANLESMMPTFKDVQTVSMDTTLIHEGVTQESDTDSQHISRESNMTTTPMSETVHTPIAQQYSLLEKKDIAELPCSTERQYADHTYSDKIGEDAGGHFSENQTNEMDMDDETKIDKLESESMTPPFRHIHAVTNDTSVILECVTQESDSKSHLTSKQSDVTTEYKSETINTSVAQENGKLEKKEIAELPGSMERPCADHTNSDIVSEVAGDHFSKEKNATLDIDDATQNPKLESESVIPTFEHIQTLTKDTTVILKGDTQESVSDSLLTSKQSNVMSEQKSKTLNTTALSVKHTESDDSINRSIPSNLVVDQGDTDSKTDLICGEKEAVVSTTSMTQISTTRFYRSPPKEISGSLTVSEISNDVQEEQNLKPPDDAVKNQKGRANIQSSKETLILMKEKDPKKCIDDDKRIQPLDLKKECIADQTMIKPSKLKSSVVESKNTSLTTLKTENEQAGHKSGTKKVTKRRSTAKEITLPTEVGDKIMLHSELTSSEIESKNTSVSLVEHQVIKSEGKQADHKIGSKKITGRRSSAKEITVPTEDIDLEELKEFNKRAESVKKSLRKSKGKGYQCDFSLDDDDDERMSTCSTSSSGTSFSSHGPELFAPAIAQYVPVPGTSKPISPFPSTSCSSPQKNTMSTMTAKIVGRKTYSKTSCVVTKVMSDQVKKYSATPVERRKVIRRSDVSSLDASMVPDKNILPSDSLGKKRRVSLPKLPNFSLHLRDEPESPKSVSSESNSGSENADSAGNDTPDQNLNPLKSFRRLHSDDAPFIWDLYEEQTSKLEKEKSVGGEEIVNEKGDKPVALLAASSIEHTNAKTGQSFTYTTRRRASQGEIILPQTVDGCSKVEVRSGIGEGRRLLRSPDVTKELHAITRKLANVQKEQPGRNIKESQISSSTEPKSPKNTKEQLHFTRGSVKANTDETDALKGKIMSQEGSKAEPSSHYTTNKGMKGFQKIVKEGTGSRYIKPTRRSLDSSEAVIMPRKKGLEKDISITKTRSLSMRHLLTQTSMSKKQQPQAVATDVDGSVIPSAASIPSTVSCGAADSSELSESVRVESLKDKTSVSRGVKRKSVHFETEKEKKVQSDKSELSKSISQSADSHQQSQSHNQTELKQHLTDTGNEPVTKQPKLNEDVKELSVETSGDKTPIEQESSSECACQNTCTFCEECKKKQKQKGPKPGAKSFSYSYKPTVRHIVHDGKVIQIKKGSITETSLGTSGAVQSPRSRDSSPQYSERRSMADSASESPKKKKTRPSSSSSTKSEGSNSVSETSLYVKTGEDLNKYIHATLKEIRKERQQQKQPVHYLRQIKPEKAKWKLTKTKDSFSFKRSKPDT